MLEAGLLDTALINSYNSFWLALLAKRSFFLLLKKGIFENLSSKQKKERKKYILLSNIYLYSFAKIHIIFIKLIYILKFYYK